jgi:hypothetical protein
MWLLPAVFPLVMAFGGVLGIAGVPIPYDEISIATSAVILGLMVALAVKPPPWIAAVLVGAFAIFHGHAHGTEVARGCKSLRIRGSVRRRHGSAAPGRHLIRTSLEMASRGHRGACRRQIYRRRRTVLSADTSPLFRWIAEIWRHRVILCGIPLAMLVVLPPRIPPVRRHGLSVLVLHPFIVLDQTLCLFAAALLGGQRLQFGFPRAVLSLLLGQAAGFAWLVLVPSIPYEIYLPVALAAVIGLIVTIAPGLNHYLPAAVMVAADFAVGLNTYPEDGKLFVLAMTLGGLTLGSAILFSLVGWPVSRLTKEWQRVSVRIAGSWLTASVFLMLALAFRP